MNIWNYLYFIPLAAALLIAIHATREKLRAEHRLIKAFAKISGQASVGLDRILHRIFPQKSKIRFFYERKILFYSALGFEQLVKLKLLIIIGIFLLVVLVKYTNICIQTDDILNKYDYRVDMLMQQGVKDKAAAMREERQYLLQAVRQIGSNVLTLSRDSTQSIIKGMLLNSKTSELQASVDTITNKVYYRLHDYFAIRQYNLILYLLLGIAFSFIPELFFLLMNFVKKADTRRELRFLKRLIILNGSIKPVDFMEVLKILIDRAKYYKSILLDIEDKNKRNSVNTREIYRDVYTSAKSLNEKLFFEKLDEANNYDFDQAVKNIAYEFNLERRELEREVRKRIDVIHVVGVTGFLLVILVMVIYLIQPWLGMYDLRQLGI